jgi:Tfp pilus assembly PilM family ATPase
MLWLLKNSAYSIGVDIGDDNLSMAQLQSTETGMAVLAGGNKSRPDSVEMGSAAWQRWTVEVIQEATANHRFHGKSVIAAVPPGEVLIEYVQMEAQFHKRSENREKRLKINDDKMSETVLSMIKQKLSFDPNDAMIQYIPTEHNNVLVMATERKIIDRHLAIYEKAGLTVKSIGAWPMALINCYTTFFGRRKADLQAVVMLLDIGTNYTNLVICRHKRLLFACSILMGTKQLDDEKMVARLVFELNACRSRFISMYPDVQIERLIFLCSPAVDAAICKTIAGQMGIQAQMGDCLAAVEISDPLRAGIDRRNCNVNWATAFGLSMS